MCCVLAFMGTPGWQEILLVLGAVLLIFGPKKLPSVARTLGRALSELRRASNEFHDNVMKLDMPDTPDNHHDQPDDTMEQDELA